MRIAAAVSAWLVTRFILFEATLHATDASAFRAGVQDVESYRQWAALLRQGSFPVDDPTFQYPPGAGLVFLAFGSDPATYLRSFTVGALVADAVILAMLLVAVTRQRGGSWRGPWTWIVGGFLVGPVMLVRFDLFPTVFAVAAALLVAYPRMLGMAAGLGAFVKVWPGLTLLGVPRRHLLKASVSSVVTVAVAWAAVAAVLPGSWNFMTQVTGRGLQIEAAAAWPFLAWRLLVDPGAWSPTARYGSVEVVSPLASTTVIVATVAGALALVALLAARLVGRLEEVPGPDVILAAVLAFLVFNKVNSPQFGVWLVAMSAAALASRRSRMMPSVVAVVLAVAVTDRVISDGVGGHGALIAGDAILVMAQGLRILLLLFAAGYALFVVLRRSHSYAPDTDVPGGGT